MQLQVSGAASLSGVLQASLINGFIPAIGNSFTVLASTTSVSGQFTSLVLPPLPLGRRWNAVYMPTNVQLTVLPGSFAADFDEDGDVDAQDFPRWKTGFGPGLKFHMQGDADGDGAVDGSDFLTWQRQLGSQAVVAVSATVPEPGTLVLLFVAAAALPRRSPRMLS